jgi:BirA family transcriptional regulator, biotin operon repressor / biotin---[acetyl-CoA-carboxylase] ligase
MNLSKNADINRIQLASIPSTNSWAKENTAIFDPDKVTCITAEEQTEGRGQFHKKWQSPKGVNLYATFHFTSLKHATYLSNLSQLLSISCCKALESLQFSPLIKWPNDLMIYSGGSYKKVGGILCELTSTKKSTHVIIGIGLNVNMEEALLEQIDQPATSLLQESKKTWDREEILERLISFFLEDRKTLCSHGFFPFRSYYESHLMMKDKKVSIKSGALSFEGICQGITEEGKLLLLLPCGSLQEISSGNLL